MNEKGKLSLHAIVEGIIDNARKTIIREQLTDPRFYEQTAPLLDDLIQQNRADAAAYEEFLRGRGTDEAAGGQAPRSRHSRGPAADRRAPLIGRLGAFPEVPAVPLCRSLQFDTVRPAVPARTCR